MVEKLQTCRAITQNGNQCKNKARHNSQFCHVHQKWAESPASRSDGDIVPQELDRDPKQNKSQHLHTLDTVTRRYMMRDEFDYMGKHVKISLNKKGDVATVDIDGKEFKAMLHFHGELEDNYIKYWMCEEAYSMFESPELLAKHIIEYWYQYV